MRSPRPWPAGDRVELRGFGAFSVKKREPRTGRNPRTGEQVAVASKRVPYFKTGKDLRDRLNKEAARAAGLLPPSRRRRQVAQARAQSGPRARQAQLMIMSAHHMRERAKMARGPMERSRLHGITLCHAGRA